MVLAVVEFRALDGAGNFLTDVDVTVREEVGGLPLAGQLYSDRDGMIAIGNPTNFVDGIIRFYVPEGAYRIEVSKDGVGVDSFHHKAVGTLAEHDQPLPASEITYDDGDSPPVVTNVQDAIDALFVGSGSADIINIKNFQSTAGDGITDCADVLEQLGALGFTIQCPAGVYIVSRKVSLAGKGWRIHGDGKNATVFKFTGTGTDAGFYNTLINPWSTNSDRISHISGCSIVCTQAYDAGRFAISMDGSALPADPDPSDPFFTLHNATKVVPDRSTPPFVYEDLYIYGEGLTTTWGRGIDICSVGFGTIDDVLVLGYQSGDSPNTYFGTGVMIRGFGIPVQIVITKLQVTIANIGLHLPDYVEGIFISDSDVIYGNHGILQGYLSGTSVVAEAYCQVLQFQASDCHFNCAGNGVLLKHSNQSNIHDCLIYIAHVAGFLNPAGVGVLVGANNKICNNLFSVLGTAGGGSASTGIIIDTATQNQVHGNKMVATNTGVWVIAGLDQDIRSNHFIGTTLWGILDQSTATSTTFNVYAGNRVDEISGGEYSIPAGHVFSGTNNKVHLFGKVAAGFANVGWEINASGQLQGTVNANDALALNRLTSDGATAAFYREGVLVGNISVTGAATAYNTSSDRTLKKDIEPLTNAIDIIRAIEPQLARFKSEPDDAPKQPVFVAQDIQMRLPNVVMDNDGLLAMDYGRVTPVLWAALREVDARLRKLEEN